MLQKRSNFHKIILGELKNTPTLQNLLASPEEMLFQMAQKDEDLVLHEGNEQHSA